MPLTISFSEHALVRMLTWLMTQLHNLTLHQVAQPCKTHALMMNFIYESLALADNIYWELSDVAFSKALEKDDDKLGRGP